MHDEFLRTVLTIRSLLGNDPNFPNYQKLVSLGNDSKGFISLFFGFPFLTTRHGFGFLAWSFRTKPRTGKSSATVLVRKPRPDPTQLEFRLHIDFTTLCLTFKKVSEWMKMGFPGRRGRMAKSSVTLV